MGTLQAASIALPCPATAAAEATDRAPTVDGARLDPYSALSDGGRAVESSISSSRMRPRPQGHGRSGDRPAARTSSTSGRCAGLEVPSAPSSSRGAIVETIAPRWWCAAVRWESCPSMRVVWRRRSARPSLTRRTSRRGPREW